MHISFFLSFFFPLFLLFWSHIREQGFTRENFNHHCTFDLRLTSCDCFSLLVLSVLKHTKTTSTRSVLLTPCFLQNYQGVLHPLRDKNRSFSCYPRCSFEKRNELPSNSGIQWEERNTYITICVRAWTIFLLNDEPQRVRHEFNKVFFSILISIYFIFWRHSVMLPQWFISTL